MLWITIIRLICAAHFHVSPHAIDEIDYWTPQVSGHYTDDPQRAWFYHEDDDCDIYVWGQYDVCIVHDAPRTVHRTLKSYHVPARYR